MIDQVLVYYRGWGEYWHWGTLHETTSLTGRLTISFEYSDEAIKRDVELSSYLLPLNKKLQQNFLMHQHCLPGPVYDALPDG